MTFGFVLFDLFFTVIYLLATDAAYQRRGLGGMLLGHVIALAEAEGKKIYLEATKVGHPLYQKLGWRDVDLITVDCRKWGIDQSDYNWVMLREPQAKV
jgi:GNAT superfamily N-acetyltransferase